MEEIMIKDIPEKVGVSTNFTSLGILLLDEISIICGSFNKDSINKIPGLTVNRDKLSVEFMGCGFEILTGETKVVIAKDANSRVNPINVLIYTYDKLMTGLKIKPSDRYIDGYRRR